MSKCNVGLSHMFIYIYILSYYKLFNLCLCNVGLSHMFIYIYILSYYKLFNLCLSVMLDCLTCSFTSISYLTLCLSVMLDCLTCSFTFISYLTTSCLICVCKGNIYENTGFVTNEDVLYGNKEVMYDSNAFGKDLF